MNMRVEEVMKSKDQGFPLFHLPNLWLKSKGLLGKSLGSKDKEEGQEK